DARRPGRQRRHDSRRDGNRGRSRPPDLSRHDCDRVRREAGAGGGMAPHGISDLVGGWSCPLMTLMKSATPQRTQRGVLCGYSALAALLFLTVSTAACSRGHAKRTTIAVVPKGQAHVFWQSVRAGAERCAADEKVDMIWTAPATETDLTGQANIVEDFVNRH